MSDSDIQNAISLFDDGKYSQALAILLPLAQSGNRDAQSRVGLAYQLGLGRPRDIAEAIKWLTLAADNGAGDAAHNLGTLYLTCEPDYPVDKALSGHWYGRAEKLGFKVATKDWSR